MYAGKSTHTTAFAETISHNLTLYIHNVDTLNICIKKFVVKLFFFVQTTAIFTLLIGVLFVYRCTNMGKSTSTRALTEVV